MVGSLRHDQLGLDLQRADVMIGRRVKLGDRGLISLEPGDFAFCRQDGSWYGSTPTGDLANLANHQITVHEDGMISVSPSILVSTSRDGVPLELWHGFLDRGVWRSC